MRLQDIKVDLQLFGLKSIHAWWIVNFFNNITTLKGQKIIKSRWKAAGILDALEMEVWKMGSTDPFADLDPTLNPENKKSGDYHQLAVCNITADEFEGICGPEI